MKLFPKEFFALQVYFAYKMAEVYEISFNESLLSFTSVYTRLFGFPIHDNDNRWSKFLEAFPEDKESQIDCIYEAYIAVENERSTAQQINNTKVTFGCFSYVYKERKNTFVLHFAGADPKGNLGKDRIPERMKELKLLMQSMKDQNKEDAQVRATSWILSIDAFMRLLPPEFVASSTRVYNNLAQDNGLWGQFVDKNLDVKKDLAKQLMENITEKNQQSMNTSHCNK